jgi:hypothetical protein
MVSRNNDTFIASIEAAKVAVSFVSNHCGMSSVGPERTFCEASDDSNWSEQAVNGDVAVPATVRNRPPSQERHGLRRDANLSPANRHLQWSTRLFSEEALSLLIHRAPVALT